MSQFLTKLDRPKLWDGYPFLLSALVGDLEDGIKLFVETYNAAGVYVATFDSGGFETATNSTVSYNVTEIAGSLTSVGHLIVYLESETSEQLTDDFRIDVIQPCANPIYLLGRDSLGGCLQWMFDNSQDFSYDFADARKAERLTLYATNLTINEWECLQDFITLGTVYRNNIVEFTSDTIKTSSRIGQQIYDVDSDGNKIGVIVIPVKNKTLTKKIKHIFEMEIEYPETLHIN